MNAKTSTIGSAPIKDARVLGKPKMLILGLQHMFAMFGATVLVPILVQSYGLPLYIQTTLFFAGFGTLFFHCLHQAEGPRLPGLVLRLPGRLLGHGRTELRHVRHDGAF